MATDFGKRLKAAREHAGLSQEQLAARAGMPQSTLGSAEASGYGSRRTPQLARACGVDPHWLATGEGAMLPTGSAGNPHSGEPPKGATTFGRAHSSGAGNIHLQAAPGIVPPRTLRWQDLPMSSLPDVFVVHLVDDSMHPEFPKDSGVLFDSRITDPRAGDAVLCKDREGAMLFRVYMPRSARHWTAAPINPAYAPLDSVADGLVVVAVKVGSWGRRG